MTGLIGVNFDVESGRKHLTADSKKHLHIRYTVRFQSIFIEYLRS
jgi:hypothetical protein